jgi:alkanesulfonate monooxygenase SsuD/methylene tetrahydromethanopterin reductase-like flavin-dependent oxidoreductase (luciferase family)
MYFAINAPNFGDYSEPCLLAELAKEAEETGWDGFFLWGHIGADWLFPVGDPWIALAAMAMATERIKLGPLVTPMPRCRPWKLARETVTLDHLSHGRLILGVGTGSDSGHEYSCFAEATDDRQHGAMLDEGLEVLTRLWSGQPCHYAGDYYQVHKARFLPTPMQSPRIPIWVADVWPHTRPLWRAARFDGVVLVAEDHALTPDELRPLIAAIWVYRASSDPFDVAFGFPGLEGKHLTELLPAYAEVGVTWWLECSSWNHSLNEVRERIRRGPPRIDKSVMAL